MAWMPPWSKSPSRYSPLRMPGFSLQPRVSPTPTHLRAGRYTQGQRPPCFDRAIAQQSVLAVQSLLQRNHLVQRKFGDRQPWSHPAPQNRSRKALAGKLATLLASRTHEHHHCSGFSQARCRRRRSRRCCPRLHAALPALVLNIGGMANLTVLGQDKVLGFDTGPWQRADG